MCHKSQRSHFQDGLDKLCQSVAKVRWSDDHSDHSESHRVVQAGHRWLWQQLVSTCFPLTWAVPFTRTVTCSGSTFDHSARCGQAHGGLKPLRGFQLLVLVEKKVEVQLGSFGLSLLSTRSPRFVLECKTQVIHIHLALKDEAAFWELIWIYLGYSRYSRYVLYRERAHVEVCRECACWNVKKAVSTLLTLSLLLFAAVWFRC